MVGIDGEKLEYLYQYVDYSRLTLEAYGKQFNIGKRTLLDVLDAENELFEASRTYLNARYERNYALYRVQAGMGKLLSALGVSTPGLPPVATMN